MVFFGEPPVFNIEFRVYIQSGSLPRRDPPLVIKFHVCGGAGWRSHPWTPRAGIVLRCQNALTLCAGEPQTFLGAGV